MRSGMVLFLAALGGFSSALDWFPLLGSVEGHGLHRDRHTLPGARLILRGRLAVHFQRLIFWTGRWLGGSCPVEHVRCALAWSNVPTVWILPFLIPELALFGKAWFSVEPPTLASDPTLLCLYWGFGVIALVVYVWEFIILLKCLGEVQGFSAWRAIGNLALIWLVFFLALNVVGLLIVLANTV